MGWLENPLKRAFPIFVLLLAAALGSGGPIRAQPESRSPTAAPWSDEVRRQAIADLPPKYREWLQHVGGLITAAELDYFLRLAEDFRRDAFLEAFWEPRDPNPRTAENELEDRWRDILERSGGIAYDDPRFLLLLLNGPPGGWTLPDGRPVGRCFARSQELEIWFYGASGRSDRRFPVILLRRSNSQPYEAYRPGETLRAVQRIGNLPTTNVQMLCADQLLRYTLGEITRIAGYDRLLASVLTPPLPSPEWLADLATAGTDLPAGAETFAVDFELRFPARKQSRAAVQGMVAISREAAPGRRFDGRLFHNFRLTGEVVRDGRLFESFHYRFEGPTPEPAASIPLGFTRYLRPGTVELRILVEDVYSGRFARLARQVEIPSPEGLPAVAGGLAAGDRPPGPTLRLYPPPGNVHVGLVRFRAQAVGELDKVDFYVDDRRVLSKRRPPYSAELDLGSDPQPHRVRVVGLFGGEEVATDQIWLNQGAQRFRVNLVEPRAGGIYPGSLTARAKVETPDGNPPQRLELYVNDELVATLREPPFAGSLELRDAEVAVVRAVAFLADGSSTEDAVVVNASPFVESLEVRLVELDALVTGGDRRPLSGLDRERFRVYEDGVEQTIRRFEASRGGAIQAALLIDRSASMAPHLERVVEAAEAFAADADVPGDRVAVLSFAADLSLDAGFDAGPGAVERALAGLSAGGRTALYDGLVQALNTFEGVGGPSAMVLYSDGRDETSRLSFEQALEAAHRSRVTVYAVALEQAFPDRQTRKVLEDLSAETGGRAWFLAGLEELDQVYDTILAELRARYRIAYQSSSTGSGYRSVRIDVDVPGAEIRARRGYYP